MTPNKRAEKLHKYGLLPWQVVFCQEYVKRHNAQISYMKARPTCKSKAAAAVGGSNALSEDKIQDYIKELMAERDKRFQLTADKIMRECMRVAFADMSTYSTWGGETVELNDSEELTEDESSAIAEVASTRTKDGGSIRIKLHDKMRALELLARMGGFLNDAVPINFNTVEIQATITANAENAPEPAPDTNVTTHS